MFGQSAQRALNLEHIPKSEGLLTISEQTVDLGTPNLGTEWDIGFVNLNLPAVALDNTAPKEKGVTVIAALFTTTERQLDPFNVRSMAGAVLIQQIPTPIIPAETLVSNVALNAALQFPQTPTAFGGRPVTFVVQIQAPSEFTVKNIVGTVTMGYTINHLHPHPRRVRHG